MLLVAVGSVWLAGAMSDVPRDQGFTRPKALLLLPMRNTAYQVVKRLVALAQKETRADSVQVCSATCRLIMAFNCCIDAQRLEDVSSPQSPTSRHARR